VAYTGLLLCLFASAALARDPEIFEIVPPGERVLQSGIEGVSALLIVEGDGRSDAGRMHSDLRGRMRLELGGVPLEVRGGEAVSVDPESGRESALAPLPARRLDLHDFIAFALETRPVFDELEMIDASGRRWRGRNADGATGMVYRDDRGRVSGYDATLPDGSGLEVRILGWTRLADFEVPARVTTADARGKRDWRLGGYREEAMAGSGDAAADRWLAEADLPAEAMAALEAERAFNLMARTDGVKAAFLRWLGPEGIVFGPGPMTVEERYANVPDAKDEQPLLQWLPEWIVIAGSRELAVISGRWELTPVDGELPTDFGQYLSIWAREGDTWKVVADIGTDQPDAQSLTPRATGRMIEALAPRPMMIPVASVLAGQVEGAFGEIAFRDGYRAALHDHADRDVIAMRVGAAAARGPEHLTVPDALADLGPSIEVTGAVASAAYDFLATWGVMDFGPNASGTERLAFLRVWQLETSKWQIIADVYREMP
jgi:hypothetical protein